MTARKEAVLAFIIQFKTGHGFAPSMREILDGTDITSTSVLRDYLDLLEKEKYISRVPRLARAIRVL